MITGCKFLVVASNGTVEHFDSILDICRAFPVQPCQVCRGLLDNSGDKDEGWFYTEKGETIVDYFVDIEAGSEEQLELNFD